MLFLVVEAASSDEDETKELGGLFTLTTTKESKKKMRKGMNDVDCSAFPVESVRDWSLDEVHIVNLYFGLDNM